MHIHEQNQIDVVNFIISTLFLIFDLILVLCFLHHCLLYIIVSPLSLITVLLTTQSKDLHSVYILFSSNMESDRIYIFFSKFNFFYICIEMNNGHSNVNFTTFFWETQFIRILTDIIHFACGFLKRFHVDFRRNQQKCFVFMLWNAVLKWKKMKNDTPLLLFCTILTSSPNWTFFISFLILPIHAASSHNFTIRLRIIILLCLIDLFMNALTPNSKIGIQRWVMAIIIQIEVSTKMPSARALRYYWWFDRTSHV